MQIQKTGATELYLELMKTSLLGGIYPKLDSAIWPPSYPLRWLLRKILPANVSFSRRVSPEENGKIWPSHAYTMIGIKRLDNLRFCMEDVLARDVPGDFIETGVWRGGAVIFMRALLKAQAVTDRTVWVADSFEGLPKPDAAKYPADSGDIHYLISDLAVSLEQVQANFQVFSLLDAQVQFLKGWFKDTLPQAPIKKIAVARLDGDIYESTMDALVSIYPKLSVGGYLIVDDYGAVLGCKKAIHDYRAAHGINDPIKEIDGIGVFWQKTV
jgi:Macrocin-O-methyltransferase (TylF)